MKSVFVLLFTLIAFVQFGFGQWNHITSPTSSTLNFVTVNEAENVCLTGFNSTIYKSLDAGSSWSVLSSNSINSQAGVVINSTTYIIVGYTGSIAGKIATTFNGGTSWTVHPIGGTVFSDVAYNGTSIVAIGTNGKLHVSNNNGLNWSNVPVSTTIDLKTVAWDNNQQKWIIGAYNKRIVTSDVTALTGWTVTNTTYEVRDLTFANNQLIECRVATGGSFSNMEILRYNSSGAISSNIEVEYPSSAPSKVVPLTGNKILGCNTDDFHLISSNDLFYISTDSIHSNSSFTSQSIKDIAAGSTFALAVGTNGAIGKYVFSDTMNLSVPAVFDLLAPNYNVCPNVSYTAIPYYNYAESHEWYVDNILVSNQDTLIAIAPQTPGFHSLELRTFYSNNVQSHAINFFVYYPPTFPSYTVTTDSSICYNSPVYFNMDYNSGTYSGFYFRITDDGVPISTNQNATNSNNAILFSNVNFTSADTVQLELYTTDQCGIQIQPVPLPFIVEPNLAESFELIYADSGICHQGSELHFSIQSTIPLASYTFKSVREYNTSNLSPITFLTTQFNTTDTVDLTIPGNQFYVYPTPDPIDNNVLNTVTLNVIYNGCLVQNLPLFEFQVTNASAMIGSSRIVIGQGDTITLINNLPSDSATWSISPTTSIAENLTDTVALFAPYTIGDYSVKLVNESRFECLDSTTLTIHVADSISEDDREVCYATKQPAMRVLGSKTDKWGNYYEYGYYTGFGNWSSFVVRKLDENGNFEWVKRAMPSPFYDGNTSFIVDIEVDNDENVYALLSFLANEDDFVLEALNIPLSNTVKTYMLKIDASGVIAESHQVGGGVYYSDFELQGDKIHLANAGFITTYDSNFNILHTSYMSNPGPNSNQPLYGSNFATLNSQAYRPLYPKIKGLPNGNVAVISDHYIGECTLDNSITINPTFPNDGQMIYAAVYNPTQGFINGKKLFDFNNGESTLSIIRDVCVDEDNNIYILSLRFDETDIYYEDSLIALADDRLFTSFVIKLNDQLETQWINGLSMSGYSMDYSTGTGKLYVVGLSGSDAYVKSQENYYLYEGAGGYTYFILDKTGLPQKVYTFDQSAGSHVTSSVSPCGNLFISCGVSGYENVPPYSYGTGGSANNELFGETFNTDSSYIFKISATNCLDLCSYIVLNTDLSELPYCSINNVIDIPIYESFNMDSIAYEIIIGGTIIESGFFPISNEMIHVTALQTNVNQSIVLLGLAGANGSDTLQLNYNDPLVPLASNSFYIACEEYLYLSLDPELFSDVSWSGFGNNYNSPDLLILPDQLGLTDTTQWTVQAIDSNNCPVSQVFEIIYCTDLSFSNQTIDKWKCFPNPANDQITLENSSAIGYTIAEVSVVDINGRIMSKKEFHFMEKIELSVKDLSDGFYLINIEVNQNETPFTIPFVKE